MATEYTTGDTAVALSGTAMSGTVAADLTGASLEVHLRKPGGTTLDKTATIVSAADGTWKYEWADDDLDTAGNWACELQVTYSGGKVQTFGPVTFTVRKQIA